MDKVALTGLSGSIYANAADNKFSTSLFSKKISTFFSLAVFNNCSIYWTYTYTSLFVTDMIIEYSELGQQVCFIVSSARAQ